MANLEFVMPFIVIVFVFEVLGEAVGDAFSKCMLDLLLESILYVLCYSPYLVHTLISVFLNRTVASLLAHDLTRVGMSSIQLTAAPTTD